MGAHEPTGVQVQERTVRNPASSGTAYVGLQIWKWLSGSELFSASLCEDLAEARGEADGISSVGRQKYV